MKTNKNRKNNFYILQCLVLILIGTSIYILMYDIVPTDLIEIVYKVYITWQVGIYGIACVVKPAMNVE